MGFRGSGCEPGRDPERAVRRRAGRHGAERRRAATSRAASRSRRARHPGQHLLTVRGSACELNAVINVLGRAGEPLARVHRLVEPHAHVRARRRRRSDDRRRARRRARVAGVSATGQDRTAVGVTLARTMSDVVDLEHRIELLREVWLFSACNEEEIERIAAMAEPRSVDAGTEVTREGEEGLEFFVVVEGDAIASVDGDEIGRIGAGGFFGEMALIDGGERVATVTAASADAACSCWGVTSSTRCSRSRCRRSLRSCSRSWAHACARSTVTPAWSRPSACSGVGVAPIAACDRGDSRLYAGGRALAGVAPAQSRPPHRHTGRRGRDRSNTGEQRPWYSPTITESNYARGPWRCRSRRARTSPERSRPPSSV